MSRRVLWRERLRACRQAVIASSSFPCASRVRARLAWYCALSGSSCIALRNTASALDNRRPHRTRCRPDCSTLASDLVVNEVPRDKRRWLPATFPARLVHRPVRGGRQRELVGVGLLRDAREPPLPACPTVEDLPPNCHGLPRRWAPVGWLHGTPQRHLHRAPDSRDSTLD